jgi:1,4-alpha-glucan branching enzyme
VPREGYRIGVPFGERWQELLNSDAELYAGSNVGNLGAVHSEAVASHGQPLSLTLNLPPLGVLVLKPA